MTVTEYAQAFDKMARFVPELVLIDRARRDKFIRDLNSMIYRDVRITMEMTHTTYAQVVERALTSEGAEDQIYRENSVRREQRRAAQVVAGPQKGGGPNDQKRKRPESSTSGGDKK